LRQSQPGMQRVFTSRHAARVGLMIVTGKVQKAVEDEHLELCSQGVAARSALAEGCLHTDRKIACDFFSVLDDVCRNE
jgi:hypothetical protein